MNKLNILISESSDFSGEARALLEQVGRVTAADLDRTELLNSLKGVQVLWIRLRHKIDAKVMEAGPDLKYIVTPTTGLNHIDMFEAEQRGIQVLSLRGELDFLRNIRASAEHTLALMLSLLRNVPAAVNSVREGRWQRDWFKGGELYEKTVGLVGFGRMARLVAKYLRAFDCEILAHDPYIEDFCGIELAQFVPLDQLLRNSDIVSMHVDLRQCNRAFFGQEQFLGMKPGALFINTARGELVDETALLAALEDGRLGGAALDVLCNEHEIESGRNKLINYAKTHDNLLITPHIAGCTLESMVKTEMFMAEKFVDALKKAKK